MIKSKPDWLYQAVPFIYSTVGVVALIYADTPLGYVVGALLTLTACLIWMKRKTNQITGFRTKRVSKNAHNPEPV